MRVLIVSPRFPEYGYRGDQLRARQLIELLAPEHALHVICGGRPARSEDLRDLRSLAQVTLVNASRAARALSALELLLARGLPAEVGWMAPVRLRRCLRRAAPTSDVVIAVTSRALTEPLDVPVILDHIDALSVNMRERSRLETSFLLRLGERLEAWLLTRHERRVARWIGAQLTVSDADAAALPQGPPLTVIPQAVFEKIDIRGPHAQEQVAARDIDLIFTGNMKYPPNRAAADWLAAEIAPELRRLRPGTRVVVAGRAADRLSLEGIEVASDVPDLSALLSRARVAIVPLRAGTGVPNKLLEAAARGAAIVATSRAATAAGVTAATADDAPGLAAAVARLLADEPLRSAQAVRALDDLELRTPTAIAAELCRVLTSVVRDSTVKDVNKCARTPNMGPAEES